MITYNGRMYSGWDAIRNHWKKGTHPRDISLISGCDVAGFRKTYEVGDGFFMYPDKPWQSPGHICSLEEEKEDDLHTGRNGSNSCSFF
jgi:hypothetical protein